MIKELWILIKMLFKSNPKEKEEVTLLGMNHFPFKGYKYLMWCGYMIYRIEKKDEIVKEMLTKKFEVSKTHETIHLMQAKICGSWVKYYWHYFVEWLKGNPIAVPSHSAYYTIPYEMEAYANEDYSEYPDGMILYIDDYTNGIHGKYMIKNGRKKLYKKVGGTSTAWKEYIKTL